MPPYEIPDKIDEAFVQGLVDRKQPENKHFEFKQQLNIKTDRQKQRFLAHASAFANTGGGFLIYGIKQGNDQLKGKASEIHDVSCTENDDDLRLTLEDLIRKGISAGLVDTEIEIISMDSEKRVLVIHVPESQAIPHRVTHSGLNKIYKRNSGGIYEPDVEELRQMFASSKQRRNPVEWIRRFREKRVDEILKGAFPFELQRGPKYIMHVVPFSAASTSQQFDLSALTDHMGTRFEHSYDGIFTETHQDHYFQVFRDGSMEFVQDHSLKITESEYISVLYEVSVRIISLPKILNWQLMLGVLPPCFVMFSLLNVHGRRMAVQEMKSLGFPLIDDSYVPGHPINREHLLIPEVRIETLEPDIDALLRPTFDRVWQATGISRSKFYDKNGTWIGPNQ